MSTRNKVGRRLRMLGMSVLLMTAPALVLAQHGEDGSVGTGDVFGDLVHIKRNLNTGQPILQKRWVEMPGDTFGWDYCPIALDANGEEIGFAELSCDPADPTAVVEVNYFGRLSGGRTKERNSRMHCDEVISSIKDPAVGKISQDPTGRLLFGLNCTKVGSTVNCTTWRVIDSPMENLALYARLMKYGHLQTDPAEEDTFAHGDPAAGTQYHPALAAADYAKFDAGTRHLLPSESVGTCFPVGGDFNLACSDGERLTSRDFVRAGSFLAGAADKTGIVTVDLVQYMNRILKITLDTELSTANVYTLPALIRDCAGGAGLPYLPIPLCKTSKAAEGMPGLAGELFVNFRDTSYARATWHDYQLEVLTPMGAGMWQVANDVRLMDWLSDRNGPAPADAIKSVNGFVTAASDALRAVEFVHNYEVPADLWDFVLDSPN